RSHTLAEGQVSAQTQITSPGPPGPPAFSGHGDPQVPSDYRRTTVEQGEETAIDGKTIAVPRSWMPRMDESILHPPEPPPRPQEALEDTTKTIVRGRAINNTSDITEFQLHQPRGPLQPHPHPQETSVGSGCTKEIATE
ncbi:unnamed protein product, partial [Amoebophrya sp. A25]